MRILALVALLPLLSSSNQVEPAKQTRIDLRQHVVAVPEAMGRRLAGPARTTAPLRSLGSARMPVTPLQTPGGRGRDAVLLTHPSLGDNGSGRLLLSFDYDSASAHEAGWTASVDDGLSWIGPYTLVDPDTWEPLPYYQPTVDYWGSDSLFYCALIDRRSGMDGHVNLETLSVTNTLRFLQGLYWDYGQHGFHSLRSVDIACDAGGPAWHWGFQSLVISHDTDSDLPAYFVPTAESGVASMAYYQLPATRTTSATIDRATRYGYSVYDYQRVDPTSWAVSFVRLNLDDIHDSTASEAVVWYNIYGNQEHPTIAVDQGNLLAVMEFAPLSDPENHDIKVGFCPTGSAMDLEWYRFDLPGDERFPRVRHIRDEIFLCTFILDNGLYATLTEDAGLTWSDAELVSGDDLVVSEYRASSIGEVSGNSVKLIWEYFDGQDKYIHFTNYSVMVEAVCADYRDLDPPPAIIGSANTPGAAYGVAVEGDYTYIADFTAGLQVIWTHDPAQPQIVGAVDTNGSAWAVAVAQNHAYVADYDYGLKVIDISNPTAPVIEGGVDTPSYAIAVAVVGDYAYVADLASFLVVDVSNPASPHIVGSTDTPGEAYGVAIQGSYAYVGSYDQGLQVVDISNPTSPHVVGGVDTPTYGLGVAVEGSYAYLANQDSGLYIIDISTPSAPHIVGSLPGIGRAYAVAVSGHTAYIAAWTADLKVVDVANPSAPVLLGSLATPHYSMFVAVGDYVYIADRNSGLQIAPLQCELYSGVADDRWPGEVNRIAISPNPSWDRTTISIGEGVGLSGELSIYDAAGRLVRRLLGPGGTAGRSTPIEWDGRDESGRRVPAGAYWVRGLSGNQRRGGRLVLLR